MIFLGFFGNLEIGFAFSNSAVVSQNPDSGYLTLDSLGDPLLPIVSLSPVLSREVIGNDVFVDVVISSAPNLCFWEFKLFYKTGCLNALDVTEGPFLKSSAGEGGTYFAVHQMNDAYNSTHGLVWAYCFMAWPQPTTRTGVLATIKFRGFEGGISHMALTYPGFTYPVRLYNRYPMPTPCTTTAGADVLIVGSETVPLDINVDVGPLYFAGEQVEFYVMTTYRGFPVTPTHITATLRNPIGESVALSPQVISIGFYKLTYTMPLNAPSGTWAIVVEATCFTDALQAYGTSFKTYLFSSTLNSKLVHIEDTVAWIQTNLGVLRTDVSNLQLHVTAIEGSTATIQTTLGTIQGTITSIVEDIATIQTDIGIVKLDISTVKAYTAPKAVDWTTIGLYISLALLVSIAIVLLVLYLYLRARFRSETTPS